MRNPIPMKALAAVLAALPALAFADEAAVILKKYDDIMGAGSFEGDFAMTAHRADGSTRTYEMRVWKGGDDKFRSAFDAPSSAKGQEILRVGDNLWVYMPNLKRAVRLAARESFMGGDFNNADVLRVNYTADYDAVVKTESAEQWTLELKAKNQSAAYDKIVLMMRKSDSQPLEGHYYAASGKELRAAEFKDVKDFKGHKRPARVIMKNMIETAKFSEMLLKDFRIVKEIPATKFVLTELGK
jgi:outer membrane lipoprotein-sorting protein